MRVALEVVALVVITALAILYKLEQRDHRATGRELMEMVMRRELPDRVLISVYDRDELLIGQLTLAELATIVYYSREPDGSERSIVYLVDPPRAEITGTALMEPGVPRPPAPHFDVTATLLP